MNPPARSGGLSLGPLLIAAVLASPALWRSLQQQMLPLYVALERLLVIAVLCVVVGDVVRRYLDVVPQPAPEPAAPAGSAGPAAAEPTPIERTPEWSASSPSGDVLGQGLFALDPLPEDDDVLELLGPE